MAQVGTRVVAAGVTVAGGVERREIVLVEAVADVHDPARGEQVTVAGVTGRDDAVEQVDATHHGRSEEHTSELQSQSNLVCRLLLEKKKKNGLLLRDLPDASEHVLLPELCA